MKRINQIGSTIGALAVGVLGLTSDVDFQMSWWLNIGIIGLCWWQSYVAQQRDISALVIVAVLVLNLVQSALLLWGALALIAASGLLQPGADKRWLWLWLTAALQPPLAVLTLKWGSQWILSADALLTASLLSVMGFSVNAVGNLIQYQVHSVLVLVGCSSIHGLSELALMTATTGVLLQATGRRLKTALLVSVVLAIGLNLIRLSTMTISPDLHTWWHEPDGETAYQGLMGVIYIGLLSYLFYQSRKEGLSA